jgi:maltooligosyltrehalose trehalohydrolase
VGLGPALFVICIQNHDQIGNRADGARLNHQIEPAAYRAASALLLLAPQTPLLFMGQEWAAQSPFLFFTDHNTELGRLVTEGRRREFGSFAAFADPAARERIPDPQALETFTRSRLDWDERLEAAHAATLCLYRRLLAFRRECPAIRHASSASTRVEALDGHTVAIALAYPPIGTSGSTQWIHVVVRLSGSGHVRVATAPVVETLFTTEDEAFAAPGTACPITRSGAEPGTAVPGAAAGDSSRTDAAPCEIQFTGPGAIVLLSRG